MKCWISFGSGKCCLTAEFQSSHCTRPTGGPPILGKCKDRFSQPLQLHPSAKQQSLRHYVSSRAGMHYLSQVDCSALCSGTLKAEPTTSDFQRDPGASSRPPLLRQRPREAAGILQLMHALRRLEASCALDAVGAMLG